MEMEELPYLKRSLSLLYRMFLLFFFHWEHEKEKGKIYLSASTFFCNIDPSENTNSVSADEEKKEGLSLFGTHAMVPETTLLKMLVPYSLRCYKGHVVYFYKV